MVPRPSTCAIVATASKLDGSYGDYVDYYGDDCETNVALYEVKLIFQLQTPRRKIQIDNLLLNCRVITHPIRLRAK